MNKINNSKKAKMHKKQQNLKHIHIQSKQTKEHQLARNRKK